MPSAAWLSTVLVSALLLLAPREAGAQSAPGSSLGESPGFSFGFGAPEADSPRDHPPTSSNVDGGERHLSLTLSPLSLALGRYGGNIDVMPGRHHAITLTPYYQVASTESDAVRTDYDAWGAELGYRFYTGEHGAEGLFIGPSLIAMRGNVSDTCRVDGCARDPELRTLTIGVAIDAGVQWISSGGLTVGGGIGGMYLRSDTSVAGGGALQFSGLLPRLLLSVGYST